MPSPSPEIIRLLSSFAVAFSVPTFANVIVLVCGTILAPGRRTVASALRVMGRSGGGDFSNYHRVLSRASWSPWLLSKLLLALVVALLFGAGWATSVLVALVVPVAMQYLFGRVLLVPLPWGLLAPVRWW
jgi:hypothetical protein